MKKMALIFTLIVIMSFTALYGTVLLTDDFTGTAGTLLTVNGWTALTTGAGATPMTIAAPGLTYTGYLSSGIGDATSASVTGEDVFKTYTSTNSGSVYYSFMFNASPTTTTAGYGIHLSPTGALSNTTFYGRFWTQKNSTTGLQFGISKLGNSPIYTGYNYTTGTTYLIIIKYTFNTGTTTDDVVDLFVNPVLGATEPAPTLTLTETATTDATALMALGIRQWNTGALARFDGIRVGTSWIDVGGTASTPIITVTGSFTPFTTTVGTASTSQSVAVSGTNLSGNVNVSAVTGYEYSTNNAAPWTSTLSAAAPYTCWARLTGASVGSFPGTVSFTSSGATQVDKAVTGSVNALTPTIVVTGSFTTFATTTGTASASQPVSVSGTNLSGNVNVSAVTGYEYSTNDAAPWTSTISAAAPYTLYVRLTGTTLGSYPGTISFTSTGATQVDKTVTGDVTAPPPVITVTGSFTTFSTSVGTPSASQSVSVTGSNLTANVDVAALAGYEFSTNDAAPWTPTLSVAAPYTCWARLTGTGVGNYNGNVTFSSTDATTVTKAVTGSVASVPTPMNIQAGQTLTRNFDDIGATQLAPLPTDWKADKNATARTVGTYSAAVTATEQYAGNSMSGTATNGIYNYGAGVYNVATDRAIGFMSSSSATKSGNLYTQITNTGSTEINSFDISYNVEKYRTGTNAAGYMIQMYSSTDGSTWTDAGTSFLASWAADGTTAGYTTAPGDTKAVSGTLTVSVPASSSLYLAWNYSVVSGTTTSSAQGLGVDDFSITALVSTVPITITSNIQGAKIYRNSVETAFTTPHVFDETPADNVTYGLQTISTQVTPTPINVTISTGNTYTLNYTNPPETTGGGTGSGADVYTEGDPINITTGDVTVTGTSGAAGVVVVTKVTPSSKGTYHGFLHVSCVYQVWTSDTAMLNGGSLAFEYTPTTPNYVAIHWGGTNNGYYPVDNPETAGVPTPGYAFNGAVSQYGFNLGNAPFTGSSYVGGVLTVGPIPTYAAKGEGVFEIILNGGDYDLPVELSSFTAVYSTSEFLVTLAWTTESETNNLGFNVFRSTDANMVNAINMNSTIITGTNSSTQQNYQFKDETVEAPNTYYYWLENIDFGGISRFNGPVMVNVLESDPYTPPVTEPDLTKLNSAYPNPFNPQTIISFDLKNESDVKVEIFNINGKLIKTLVNRHLLGERHYSFPWYGTDENGKAVGSGIYFYRMVAGKYTSTQKVVLMK